MAPPPGGIPIGNILDGPVGSHERELQVSDDATEDEEVLAFESVDIDYIHWSDWFCSPARTWDEVRWIARRVYMNRDQLAERFGRAVADEVPLDWMPESFQASQPLQPEHQIFGRATVFEIWNKTDHKVTWLAYDFLEKPLDERDDPLKLPGFFPTPRPLYATLSTESLRPVPDFHEYRDQATQLDTLTARIEAISRSIKVAGVYDAAQQGIERMFQEGVENQLIPVNQWGAFAEAGGLKGSIDLLDISALSEVLERLVAVRAQAKDDLYEVTGISDIIRGTSVASETATAQQIKAGFGTMRLRARQAEVARFCRDVIRLVAEVVCEHFNPRLIALIADVQSMSQNDRQYIMPAITLLKDDKTRPLRIDIEADSTIMANQQQEQQARIQFLQMAGDFLQKALPMAQQSPQLAPLAAKMLLFGIRSFPQGAELESDFEQAAEALEQAAKMPQPPPPDPKLIVAQAQVENIHSQIADRQMRSQADANAEDAEARYRMGHLAVMKGKEDDANAARAVQMFHDRESDHRDFILDAAKLQQDGDIARLKAQQPKGRA